MQTAVPKLNTKLLALFLLLAFLVASCGVANRFLGDDHYVADPAWKILGKKKPK